jgi:DNA modification methylase
MADIAKMSPEELEEENAVMLDLLNPFWKNEAEEIAEKHGRNEKTIKRTKELIRDKIPDIGKMSPEELEEENLDFLVPYKKFIEEELLIYNIWNKSKGDEKDYFGHFPKIFMKNLLYYYTEPFDFVYDPFAGSGTTIDACTEMFRKYHVTDLTPDKSREEIIQHDIKDGLPKDLPKPKFVFLDPPYWKQAEGKYSDSPDDLGNMELDEFYGLMSMLLQELSDRKIEKIAIVISPTQYPNENHEFEDHIFVFNGMISDKYKIKMRYLLPYSSEQYNGNQVDIMKKEKKPLSLIRDLVVWEKKQ